MMVNIYLGIKAFALSGRLRMVMFTQGVALGYRLIGLSAHH